uniref:Uncharacterized protein n=1 Tax=Bartonella schoenbuchensis (strain DSM 13525 / NCTC 13165 / R1) TaxID=687861 RepID=E6YXL2_BARSR|nr:hypothetical protein B11C_10074 [Bartonella schoenbuchensis R1]
MHKFQYAFLLTKDMYSMSTKLKNNLLSIILYLLNAIDLIQVSSENNKSQCIKDQ